MSVVQTTSRDAAREPASPDTPDAGTDTLTDNPYEAYFRNKFEQRRGTQAGQMGVIDMIAGGIITLVVVAIVLNQLVTLSIVNNTTGPFSGLIDSVENIGSSALTLIVVGFLAAAAGVVLSMFRGRF